MTWWMEVLAYLGCIALALALRLWVLNITRVQGSSMLDTLRDGDWLFVWRLPYRFRRPQRQEVVICHYPARSTAKTRSRKKRPVRKWRRCRLIPQSFVKRIVGVPGDTVELVEGKVLVNGLELEEAYLSEEYTQGTMDRPLVTLGAGEYFVMGDNRDRSNDSRYVGPLMEAEIRGRVTAIIWPPKRMRQFTKDRTK